ncbi:MAG: kelch repeat-containing protein, partial [Acidobacteriota bacterium]
MSSPPQDATIRNRVSVLFLWLLLVMAEGALGDLWLPVEPMTRIRERSTTTVLLSGQVLVAGGFNNTYLRSSILFDPRSGSWFDTGQMTVQRSSHTATLLPDGRVLVVGGENADCLSSVELYDPATGVWTLASPLRHARSRHTATLLPSGEVLVAGGSGVASHGCRGGVFFGVVESELYDPVSDTWTAAGDLETKRSDHTATLLPSGEVLVVGGSTGSHVFELYDRNRDPDTAWTSHPGTEAMDRFGHSATLLPNGHVLMTGGRRPEGVLGDAWLYDPVEAQWHAAASMTSLRAWHTATLLPTGHVLVHGGNLSNDTTTRTAERFDPEARTEGGLIGAWTPAAPATHNRSTHGAVLLANGDVLVHGGDDGGFTAEVYHPAVGDWSDGPSLQHGRLGHTATLLDSGTLLVVGGFNTSPPNFRPGAEQLDLRAEDAAWRSTESAYDTTRYFHTATRLRSGRVLVVGGSDGDVLSTTDLFDPADGSWTVGASLPAPRYQHTATRLVSGEVLVVGGRDAENRELATVELYDPDVGTWSTVGSLRDARREHTATLLSSGKVLVTGGRDEGTSLASVEIYDPWTRSWTVAANMRSTRFHHSATLLPSGEVLIAGGEVAGASFLSRAEVYDPVSGRWTEVGTLAIGRTEHTATLLASGEVLVAGGFGHGFQAESRIEIYHPASRTWSTAGDLTSARGQHRTVLLPSGELLVIGGGLTLEDALASVEVFADPSRSSNARRPRIDTIRGELTFESLDPSEVFAITGVLRADASAGSGTRRDASEYGPMVWVRSLDGGQHVWLEPDALPIVGPPPWDGDVRDETVTLTFPRLPTALHPGRNVLNVVTAGVWSDPIVVDLTCGVGLENPAATTVDVLESGVFEVSAAGAVAFEWEVCHGDPETLCAPPEDPENVEDRGGPGWRTIAGATGSVLVTDPIQGAESGNLYRVLA